MSEFIKNATDLIEQGHIRVGTEVVKDPAFLVSRTLEDFVTWVDSSAIRKHVMEYNNMVSIGEESNRFRECRVKIVRVRLSLWWTMNISMCVIFVHSQKIHRVYLYALS